MPQPADRPPGCGQALVWVLWLMLVFHVEPHYYEIETYRTFRACETARAPLESDMHRAYPEDHQLRLFCQQRIV
jgi:hypothetical protein